jgi:hypothetical protein
MYFNKEGKIWKFSSLFKWWWIIYKIFNLLFSYGKILQYNSSNVPLFGVIIKENNNDIIKTWISVSLYNKREFLSFK